MYVISLFWKLIRVGIVFGAKKTAIAAVKTDRAAKAAWTKLDELEKNIQGLETLQVSDDGEVNILPE